MIKHVSKNKIFTNIEYKGILINLVFKYFVLETHIAILLLLHLTLNFSNLFAKIPNYLLSEI